jgi:hypothetical protein
MQQAYAVLSVRKKAGRNVNGKEGSILKHPG